MSISMNFVGSLPNEEQGLAEEAAEQDVVSHVRLLTCAFGYSLLMFIVKGSF